MLIHKINESGSAVASIAYSTSKKNPEEEWYNFLNKDMILMWDSCLYAVYIIG